MSRTKQSIFLLLTITMILWFSFFGYKYYDKIKIPPTLAKSVAVIKQPDNQLKLVPEGQISERQVEVNNIDLEASPNGPSPEAQMITHQAYLLKVVKYQQSINKLNNIIIDFLQDKLKPAQLDITEYVKFTQEAYRVLELIQEYATLYPQEVTKREKARIFPQESTFMHQLLEKFVTVEFLEEKSQETLNREIFRQKIIDNLPALQSYLASDAILHHYFD